MKQLSPGGARQRKSYAKHRDRYIAKYRAACLTPEGRATRLLYSSRQRAKRLGVDNTLTADWIVGELKRGCAITGLPFDLQVTEPPHAFSPSIDRIEAGGPYSAGNCRVVLWAVNTALGHWGVETFTTIARAHIETLHG